MPLLPRLGAGVFVESTGTGNQLHVSMNPAQLEKPSLAPGAQGEKQVLSLG